MVYNYYMDEAKAELTTLQDIIMNAEQHSKLTKKLTNKISKILKESKSDLLTLQQKIDKRKEVRSLEDQLFEHKLNYFTLVNE